MPTQLPAQDPLSFRPQIAWGTIAQEVVMTGDYTYQVRVVPTDSNELGAELAVKEVGFFLKDFIGTDYRLSAINVGGDSDVVELLDIFKTGFGPQIGQPAIVYKSVGDGTAPYLAPIRIDQLDKSARDASDAIEKDILWKGQKPIRVAFMNSSEPAITGYDSEYAKYFDQDVNITLYSYENGKWVKRMEEPCELNYIQKEVDGEMVDFLDEIKYDLAEPCSGYIKLAR